MIGSNAFTKDDMVAVYSQRGLLGVVVEITIRVDQSAPAALMSLFSLNNAEQGASVRLIGLNCRDSFFSFFWAKPRAARLRLVRLNRHHSTSFRFGDVSNENWSRMNLPCLTILNSFDGHTPSRMPTDLINTT